MDSTSEAAWNDLYNGVTKLLGPERAETLMTHLLRYDPSQIAMKSDIADVKSDIRDVKSDLSGVKSDITGLRSEMAALRSDLSGLYRTLIGGFIVLMATMVGVLFAVL